MGTNPPTPYPRVRLPFWDLPAHFLAHAPRLRYLELASLGNVREFPQGFLAHAPQLRYLNLDANLAEAPAGRLPHPTSAARNGLATGPKTFPPCPAVSCPNPPTLLT